MESTKSKDIKDIKDILNTIIIFIVWILLILAFPNKDQSMNEKNHWVIDDDSRQVLASNKTKEEADSVKAEYPYNNIIILKEVK